MENTNIIRLIQILNFNELNKKKKYNEKIIKQNILRIEVFKKCLMVTIKIIKNMFLKRLIFI